MSSKGYGLESEIETYFLNLASQTRDMPLYERCHRITSSGAMRGDKGDVVTVNVPFLPKQLMIECKRRKEIAKSGKVIHVYLEWLEKAELEAHNQNCIPIFIGSFTYATRNRKQIIVTDEFREFEAYIDTIKAKGKKYKSFLLEKTKLDGYYKLNNHYAVELVEGEKRYSLITWDSFTDILEHMREGGKK